jgi:integrase
MSREFGRMGRRRLHNDPRKPLPPGLYLDWRQYRARRPGQPWTYFGTDYVAAVAAYAVWRYQGGSARDVAWLMDLFVGQVCPDRVKAKTIAARTARDYLRDSPIIKKGLGHIPIAALEPKHIAKFRDTRGQAAPSHVRNEMACLSSALSWAVEAGIVPTNVAKEVRRPRKSVRERLVTDAEYIAVHAVAGASVRLAMVLCVRTLGLPADVLRMGRRNLVHYDDGRQTMRFKRGKTGIAVEIEIVGELAAALEPFLSAPTLHPTFVRREDGKPYTVDGIGAMFRRCCIKAKVEDFGLRDLRAKGATEMYRAAPNNVRKIQLLLGHKSVQTTEIYLKGLLAEIVRPNERPIIAEVLK